ncbi:MAG: hypothetical protein PVF73_07780, partial [Bacteroidales bacterium]
NRVNKYNLKEIFEDYGKVVSVKIIEDKQTGKSKGYAFVEMDNLHEARNAITELNGFKFQTKNIIVNEAKGNDVPRLNRKKYKHY